MRQVLLIFHAIILLICTIAAAVATLATFFIPMIVSFLTWNWWYMILFFVSWLPALAVGVVSLILIAAYAELFT